MRLMHRLFCATATAIAAVVCLSAQQTPGGSTTAPGGATTNVQFNSAGAFGGDAKFLFADVGGSTPRLVLGNSLPTAGAGAILQGGDNPILYLTTVAVSESEPLIHFAHLFGGYATDWTIASNDEGNDVYEWSLTERTNNTYKVEVFKGTAGELLLNQSGGNVGIGVAPAATSAKLTVGGSISASTTVTSTFLSQGSGMVVANVGANSCGTSAATIAGNSNAFVITVGATSATQCRVTFPTAAATEWDCTSNDDTTTVAVRTTPVDTTHTDFIGAFIAADKVTGICFAR